MEWTMQNVGGQDDRADCPGLRMITIPRTALPGRQSDLNAAWQVSTPATIRSFSAVATFFGRRLHDELGVPVGLINTSWGGTRIEAWTSRETLVKAGVTRDEVARYELTTQDPAFWAKFDPFDLTDPAQRAQAQATNQPPYPADPGNDGEKQGWARPDWTDQDWPSVPVPGRWQDHGHEFSGVFWYRREVELPATWAGGDLLLEIGAVDKQDITYFNGERVGATGTGFDQSCWNLPRSYRVPGRLVRPGRNVVAVRAFSFAFHGGMIGPDTEMRVRRAAGTGEVPLAGTWRMRCEHDLGFVQPVGELPGPGNPNSPYILYDNMIDPLRPYAIRGAIWYQGESNTANAADYGRLLVSMIRDWRHAWGQGDFAFLTVQLANYTAPAAYQAQSSWAVVREGELQALSEPATGLAVAIDIGEANDIHPRNKRDVGARLAQWALARIYGVSAVASGPLFAGATIEGDRVRVRFDHIAGGLVARGGSLRTFFIAGANRKFVAAQAEIDGDTVVVRHPDVAEPVAVRYAWADNPDGCNLYNAAGLPASPFRTDAW
jgi:sialate O-acetylesterase